MTYQQLSSLEEMSTKLVEYINTISKDEEDREYNLVTVASKFILASMSADDIIAFTKGDLLCQLDYIKELMMEAGDYEI